MREPSETAPDDDILERYLAGEPIAGQALPDEARWRDVRHTLRSAMPSPERWNVAHMLGKVLEEIQLAERPRRPLSRDVRSIPSRPMFRRTMASAFGVAMLAAFIVVLKQWPVAISVRWARPTEAESGVHETQYATVIGQRATVTLHDGTRITLAPQTTLRVPTDFGQTSRLVTLDGEGYFDVRVARGMPFLVRAGMTTTRVLGTTFDVRRYTADTRTQVAVISGRVAVAASTHARRAVAVTSGSVAVTNDANDSIVVNILPDSATRYSAWTSGTLVFHETPASDVLATLSRWYPYNFRLADSTLARRNLTAWFSTSSASEVFANLKLLLNVELTFDGNVVTLHPRRSPYVPTTQYHRNASEAAPLNPTEVGR